MKISVCLHLFYTDMVDDIINYLKNIDFNYKLYVSIVENQYNQKDILKLKNFKKDVVIIHVKNRGVDVGGFLNTLKHLDRDTDLILKIHTKKGIGSEKNPSNAVKQKGYDLAVKQANNWFHNLMRGVLNNKNQVNNIINTFKTNSKCGMVGFKLYQSLGPNKKEIITLLDKMNISHKFIGGDFIGGTMFWVRYKIIKNYLTDDMIDVLLNEMKEGYILEPSVQHALERIFGYMVNQENQEILIVN